MHTPCHEAGPALTLGQLCTALAQETMAGDSHMPGVPGLLARPRGILSDREEDNPVFWDANHVFVWYCSSDSHLGAPAGR